MFKYTMNNGGPLMYCSFNEFITVINSLSNDIKIDLNYYILKNNFLENHFLFYDTLYDKYAKPIFFLCNLKDQDIFMLKHIHIYGFYGKYFSHNDFLQMELCLRLNENNTSLEVIKIHSGAKKRQGRGSLALEFLEDSIIPYLNNKLKSVTNGYKINCIYGISADLSDDTTRLDRAKFYYKNGFELINNHFYKYL